MRYDRGEIDIPEFMEGYIRIKLNMPKINMEKDKAGVVYGNRKTMARVKTDSSSEGVLTGWKMSLRLENVRQKTNSKLCSRLPVKTRSYLTEQ